MVEQEPVSTDREEFDDTSIKDFLKRHRFLRHPINLACLILLYFGMVFTPTGRKLLIDRESRRFLFDQEARVGLLEDSIFSNELYYPNTEETSLLCERAVAGRYAGYDFNRPSEFGQVVKERGRQLWKDGRLLMLLLDEIVDNFPTKRTDTYLPDIYNVEHLFSLQPATIDDLLQYGLVEETTYKKAYDKVGLYHKFRLFMALQGITNDHIYRVTPKGNGLVILARDFGEEKKLPDGKKVLKPAFGV